MAQRINVAIDCRDPDRLAAFWMPVLDYELADPPSGHTTWAELSLSEAKVPGEAWIKLRDPEGRGPTLLFHRVPEAKTFKNRVHLDVRAPDAGTDDRPTEVNTFIARVVGLGGSKVRDVVDDAGYFAVMQDPEGNEFCVG